ncbi:M14 family metallopeptidase [Pseudoalteromonas tunicata]|jgi:hypothetical protein|uniref:Peptidase M14 domain-containing protein n=1 Tax=Pseudoalteromonas tunicata D2 TaxID=87626 RepID=A4C9S7_9GAMM|nr:hypothetical protein PTUN_a2159 [Pseudoalteromonas tunicata]AXT30400.1 peptidase M14 [Pseudoalteromonas tunicata]EAR28135.1 hypothetical protein PTD2_20007 [Pseudoalteromonas tunicata D2]
MLTPILMAAALASDFHLPIQEVWHGKSELLMQQQGPLITEFELSGGLASPNYQMTMEYVDKLVSVNPDIFALEIIGYSDQKRAIKMLKVTASKDKHQLNDKKPTLLIQAGIHSGEIDGKDAGFMLLRDIAVGDKKALLDKVNILFIPILNVDGHERSSEFNRINQRGPVEMGFRTNAKNLNLNRDYTKLDTPEIRALVKVVNQYNPQLYLDIHVTDGADYQYDVTYGFMPTFASESPKISTVLANDFRPKIDSQLHAMGHLPGDFVFLMDPRDLKQGLAGWVATPRYSNAWGDLRNLPTILVENHSLKPYKQRVLGTYVFLEAVINTLAEQKDKLIAAVKFEQQNLPSQLVVERGYSKEPDHIDFAGISYEHFDSELTGHKEVRYTGKKQQFNKLPIYWQKDKKVVVDVPKAFYVPAQYPEVLQSLSLQGIEYQTASEAELSNLEQWAVNEFKFAALPFEGRMRVSASFDVRAASPDKSISWYKVPTSQPLGKLAVHLLHPQAQDSLFQWGFFNTIFQRTEYVENYALEPYAKVMLAQNSKVKAEFDAKLADPAFANSADARAAWLYKQTPYYDQAYLQYPILIER